MRRALIVLATSFLSTVALGSEPVYSFDLDVSPTDETGFYMCRATVTNLETGELVFGPAIQLSADSPANARSADGDCMSELSVFVDSKTSRVTAEVRITRAGTVVAAQRTSVAIR